MHQGHVFLFVLHVEVTRFLRWPALESVRSTNRLQLGKILSAIFTTVIYRTRRLKIVICGHHEGDKEEHLAERWDMRETQHHCNMM